ncbi:MAG: hypothetical protein AB7K09_02285 [Planctomycetota bacterium]
MKIAQNQLQIGAVLGDLVLDEARPGGPAGASTDATHVANWVAVRPGGERVWLRVPLNDTAAQRMELEWHTRRQLTAATTPPHSWAISATVTDQPRFPGYLVGEMVPAESLQERLLAGKPLDPSSAFEVLDGLLAHLDACARVGVQPPDLTQPCVWLVDRSVKVAGTGTGDWTVIGPQLRDLALAMHGAEPPSAALAFADALPQVGQPLHAAHLRSLLVALCAGSCSASERRLVADPTTTSVTCPGCGVRYLLSAGVCRSCQIDLRTGVSLAELRLATGKYRRRNGGSGWLGFVTVQRALIGIGVAGTIAAVGAAFGWSFAVLSVALGLALAGLLLGTAILGS